ncbi:unnamed protein product [Alternaria alternata]
MDNVPREIQEAIGSDDTDKLLKLLRVHPERSYEELQDSLTIAISTGSLRTIEVLLDHGATFKYSSYDELFIREEPAVFKQLIDHGWDINSTEFERPPVHQALHNESLLRWLLDNGADSNIKSVRRSSCLQPGTALAAAAQLKDPTALQILLSHGAEMDPLALFHAIKVRGHKNGTATMAVLIDHGADVNYMAKNWATPLIHSVHYRSKEKLLYLLKHGADPTIRGRVSKNTPAECAQRRGDQELFEILKAAEVEHGQ